MGEERKAVAVAAVHARVGGALVRVLPRLPAAVAAARAAGARIAAAVPKVQLIPEGLVYKPIRQARLMGTVIPLAAMSARSISSANPLAAITPSFLEAIASCLNIYTLLIIARIFLTWFPNFNWNIEPFKTMSQVTDPFLNVFQNLLPPIANIDFTPIFGIMVLQWLQDILTQAGMGTELDAVDDYVADPNDGGFEEVGEDYGGYDEYDMDDDD